MKTVISSAKTPEPTMSRAARLERFYGVQLPKGQRAFISQERYHEGKFIVHGIQGLTYGSAWSNSRDNISSDSLVGTLESVLEEGWQVFEFDTAKEMFTWIFEVET